MIPNSSQVLYNIFFTPLNTKNQRRIETEEGVQHLDTGSNSLLGNLFAEKHMSLHPVLYDNLIETLTLHPKKKHYKKLINFIINEEKVENVSSELIHKMIKFGI